MDKKSYESYEYIDPDSLYTYKNSIVLKNKQGITDPEKASHNEHILTTKRVLDLSLNPIMVNSVKDILKIHHYIFQDSYEWAGEFRQVNVSKSGNAFLPIQSFESGQAYLNSLIKDFHNNANSRKEIVRHLAKILDNLNYFHPFREGNGRTQREVIRVLALSKGYIGQIAPEMDSEIYNLYMDGTVCGDIPTLEKLFNKILKN
ncbi:Fic family protein [Streptococcus merionis]|uniref:Fic/DOC family protein n=1 Tax=Streptococcus merionis TaxID=400065 RepID=UPI0026F2CB60|nr:Fic family protein [Streptococcus merionis]